MLGLAASLQRGGASLLTYVKDNLKLYLDFKKNRSDTLAFPSEGSTSFDGNDYIQVSPIPTTSATGSVCAWVKNSADDGEGIITFGDANADSYFGLAIGDGSTGLVSNELVVIARTVAGTNSRAGFATTGSGRNILVDGNWHHVAVTGDGSEYKIYIDGVSQSINVTSGDGNNGAWTNVTGVDEFYIGKHRANGSDANIFNGKMANVGLWSRVLSLEEINSVMNKSYSQLGSVEKTSLVMWQSLDSQSNGLVQPATGETLGSELISANTTSEWNQYGSPSHNPPNDIREANTDNGVALTSGSDLRNAYRFVSGLTDGKLYKLNVDAYYSGSSDTPQLAIIPGSGTLYTSVLTTTSTNYSIYFVKNSGAMYVLGHGVNNGNVLYVENLSIKEITSNTGVVTGATTTTSVYGGNAPILPRAIDIAESFADKIGNGSALFDGNTNHIDIGQPSVLATLGSSDFAITCWINPDVVSGAWDGLLYIGQGASSNGHLGINPSGYLSGGTGDGSNWVTIQSTTNLLVVGEWAHCAMVRKNDVIYLYKNGIEIKQGSHSVIPSTLDEDAWIAQGGSGEYYDGNISQIGIWQGALTQSQVQSVMESTSYAKIPASVKSTLGSEKVGDSSFEDASYWSILLGNGGVDVNTTNAGKLTVANVHETRLSKTGILENGKLYKLDFVVDSLASGRIRGLAGFTNIFNPVVGTNTKYFVASGTDFTIHFDKYGIPSNTNATLTMTDISIKEVICDLVAYYPLDADSSANGVTNDVTTGEVLSDELFTGSASSGNWTWDSSANTLTGASATNDAYSNVLSGVAEGDIVKVTFDITGFTGGGFYLNLAGGAYPSFNVANGSYTIYTISGSGTKKLAFDGSSPFTGVISNISAKKVTSNTGVLK